MRLLITMLFLTTVLAACHRDPQNPETIIRQDFTEDFAEGTRFAIARQSYPSSPHERIITIDREKINKQIQKSLEENKFIYDAKADYVISYYRERYTLDQGLETEVHVDLLAPKQRLSYVYSMDGVTLVNPRDGALVLDIIDTRQNKLLRQLVIPYYFTNIQTALRESRDREDVDYVPTLNIIGRQIGL